jgi:hypothetical protein
MHGIRANAKRGKEPLRTGQFKLILDLAYWRGCGEASKMRGRCAQNDGCFEGLCVAGAKATEAADSILGMTTNE